MYPPTKREAALIIFILSFAHFVKNDNDANDVVKGQGCRVVNNPAAKQENPVIMSSFIF
jgi:hypothetical protein